MRKLITIFLPYLLFVALGAAIWLSNRPGQVDPVVIAGLPTESTSAPHCDGCGSGAANAKSTITVTVGEAVYRYCCEHCRDQHAASGFPQAKPVQKDEISGAVPIDPVCHMEVTSKWGFVAEYEHRRFYFCTLACRDAFVHSPTEFLADRCTVCRKLVDSGSAVTATYLGKTYRMCSEEHRREFKADPASFFLHTMWGIPPWLYYTSIAFVLVVSFGAFEGLQRRLSPGQGTGAALPIVGQTASVAESGDRINLLAASWLRLLLTSRPVRFAGQLVVVALFFLVLASGLFGNQNPALNIAPILTWTIWWGGLVILIMFAGKAWCFVCPWDAVAGWMEKLRFWRKNPDGLGLNLKWPRAARNIVLATALFVGLTWIELGFGVTMRPAVTAYLAIAMLLMAIASVFLFEKKSFCRYACLVGRVSGLYAMFAGVEIRSKSAAVCKSCRTKECVHGSDKAYGCPTFLYPGNLASNTYCIQCGECLQACPHDNLALNLRPWGEDLVHNHRARTDEAYLALLMLSITGFHGLTMTPNWQILTEWLSQSFSLGRLVAFSLGMSAIMLVPLLVYAALMWLSYQLGLRQLSAAQHSLHDYFVRYAYALLPIALFYHLAHNLEHLLMEGPKVVRLISDPFGWGQNWFGTANWVVPPLVSLDVLWGLQVTLVLVGHVYSLWVAQRTASQVFGTRRAAFHSQLPVLAGMIAFSVFSLWLLKQPMEMRTSAM